MTLDEILAIGEREYDPALHVTAGELRAIGKTLPEEIPDCAYMPRAALCDPTTIELVPVDIAGRTFNASVLFSSHAEVPFRWLEIDCVLVP